MREKLEEPRRGQINAATKRIAVRPPSINPGVISLFGAGAKNMSTLCTSFAKIAGDAVLHTGKKS